MALLLFISPLLHGMGALRSIPAKFGPSRPLLARSAAMQYKTALPAANRINPLLLPTRNFASAQKAPIAPGNTQNRAQNTFKNFNTQFGNFTQKPQSLPKSGLAATGIAGGVSLATVLMVKAGVEKEVEALQKDIQQDKTALEKLESTALKTDQNKSNSEVISQKKAELKKAITVKQHLLAFAQKILIMLMQYYVMGYAFPALAAISPVRFVAEHLYTSLFITYPLTMGAVFLSDQCGYTDSNTEKPKPKENGLYGWTKWFMYGAAKIALSSIVSANITRPTMDMVSDFAAPVTVPLANAASDYVAAPLSYAAYSVYTHAGPVTKEIYHDIRGIAAQAKKFSVF